MQQHDEKLFGDMAVQKGYITHEQLQECLTLKTESGDEKALWQIVVEKSYIDHHTTNQLLDNIKRKKTAMKSKKKVDKFFGDIAVTKGFCSAEQMDKVLDATREILNSR